MTDPKTLSANSRRIVRSARGHTLAVLLATTALGIVSAHAVDGTWIGATTEWVDGTNWTSNPTVPDGTATFSNTGSATVANDNGGITIGAIQFTAAPNAQAYTININNTAIINGTGISNNSTNLQTFNVNDSMILQNASTASGGTGAVTINVIGGFLTFQNTSTAGTATVVNGGVTQFFDSSSAGSAGITNNATMDFFDSATSGAATIGNSATGTLTFNNNASAGTAVITNDNILQFNNASTAATANITNNGTGVMSFNGTATASGSTIVNNGGDLSFNNTSTAGTSNITNTASGTFSFNDTATAGSATILNNGGGVINFNNTSTAASANITNNNGSTSFLDTSNAGSATILNTGPSATYFTGNSSAGSANITNVDNATFSAVTVFYSAATAATSTITNNIGGSTVFGTSNGTDTATAGSATITNNLGGQTQFFAATTAGNAVITNNLGGFLQFGTSGGAGTDTATAGNAAITSSGVTRFYAATTAGNATLTTNNGATVSFSDSSTGGSAQFITNAGGTFDMSTLTAAGMTAGSIAGAGSYVLGAKNLAVGSNNLSTTVSGVISGAGGSLTKVGTGALTLTNTNTYSGATTVNGGTLIVNGSTAASSLTTVNAGSTLAGSGIVGNTAVAGGILAPGSTGSLFGPLTVQGTLSFTAASTYMIQVSPANAGRTNVTGAATLGGATVSAVFGAGSFVNQQYTILNATGGVTGTFNPTVASNLANIQSALSYDANNAYLNVTFKFTPPPGGFNLNQQNVANTLTNFFNSTGSIPAAFAGLNAAGLTVASGELGTGAIQSAIRADGQFLNLLLDPGVAGRSGAFVPPGSASPYAAEQSAMAYYSEKRLATPSERAAFAMATKAPLLNVQPANRWSVWGAAYGGSATSGGNAIVGSQDLSARVWGVAAGADYKVAPNTLLGFALAGGGTNYSLANALGRGSSDLFQAGIYGRHNFGPAYIAAALAYGWHDVTTNRTVTLVGFDQLQGRYKAETFSGRFEGGYRFATPVVGITPYAAAQVTSFGLPAYAEQAIVGTPLFALNYAGQTTTATRSELGLRTDKSWALQGAMLTLRGRAAWAHDYNPDRAVTALFQALPGTTFVVNGARGNADAALVSAGAEVKWLNGFSLAGTFEGEFSGNVASYAGKGVAKYSW